MYISHQAGIYLLKVNNRNTRARCEICSDLTIKRSQRRQWRRFGVFIVNFEHVLHLVLLFLLLTLNIWWSVGACLYSFFPCCVSFLNEVFIDFCLKESCKRVGKLRKYFMEIISFHFSDFFLFRVSWNSILG